MISSLFSSLLDTLGLLAESDLGLCAGALALVALCAAAVYKVALPEE